MVRAFKYLSMFIIYGIVIDECAHYFFIIVLIENIFFIKFFTRISKNVNLKTIRKIFCFILIVLGFWSYGVNGFFRKIFIFYL